MMQLIHSCILPLMMVATLGTGALLAQCNIKFGFCLVLVLPEDFDLLGLAFEGTFLF